MAIKLQGTNSAAAPGLTNDGGDGVVVGTDSVDISTGGTSRLKVDSSGRVDLGGSTNSSTGIGVLRTKHHTTSNNPVNMIGCVSGSGYNNVQIGGNDTSFTGTAATNVRFYTGANATTANGTLRGYWDGSGNLGISDGNLVIGTAGHGIDFSAQTSSSASGATTTHELLDHYEEGTWTPADQTGNGLSISVVNATYVRVGDLVFVEMYVTAPTTTVATHCGIQGLPFNVKGSNHYSYLSGRIQTLGASNITAQVNANTDHIFLYHADNALGWDNVSGCYMLLSGCYQTS